MKIKSIALLLAALAFAISPFFVESFDGFDPALYPIPQIDPPIQPARWAFAIWGVIYLWLIVHAAYGLFKRADDPTWDRARLPLIMSLGLGAAWLSVAERSPIWATVHIFVMLVFAIWALAVSPRASGGRANDWLAQVPMGLYAGWLSAASFASLGMVGAGWGLWMDENSWAIIGITAATTLALFVQTSLGRAPSYGLAVIWALVAIAAKDAQPDTAVALLAAGAAFAMALATLRAARSRA